MTNKLSDFGFAKELDEAKHPPVSTSAPILPAGKKLPRACGGGGVDTPAAFRNRISAN